jgi:hypothetical protein
MEDTDQLNEEHNAVSTSVSNVIHVYFLVENIQHLMEADEDDDHDDVMGGMVWMKVLVALGLKLLMACMMLLLMFL